MSARYPPRNVSFAGYDEDQRSNNAFNDPYADDTRDDFENSSVSLNAPGLTFDKTRSSLYQTGPLGEKTQASMNQPEPLGEKTRSNLNQPAQNNLDTNANLNASETNEPPRRHEHRHHTHEHRHHHHDHDHEHRHQHHHHEHEPEHFHHEHEHHHHEHQHHHHEHEHPQHFHDHDHDHEHHHHNHEFMHEHVHHSNTPPLPPIHQYGTPSALTIRRNTPGTGDPTLYQFPIPYSPDHMYAPPVHNVSLPPNVRVSIRRNTPQADQTFIQPILYPVAVYTNTPVSQPRKETPEPRILKRPREQPKPPTPKPGTPMRTSPIPPVRPARVSPPPPPKPPVKSPIKTPPPKPQLPPPVSPKPAASPPPKNPNALVRKPIRTDDFASTVQRVMKAPPPQPPNQAIYQNTMPNQYYRRTSVHPASQRRVSYRVAPGMTTREMENDEMDDSGAPIYVHTPRVQAVTYRQ